MSTLRNKLTNIIKTAIALYRNIISHARSSFKPVRGFAMGSNRGIGAVLQTAVTTIANLIHFALTSLWNKIRSILGPIARRLGYAPEMRSFVLYHKGINRSGHIVETAPDTKLDAILDRFFDNCLMKWYWIKSLIRRTAEHMPHRWINFITAIRIRLEMTQIIVKERLTIYRGQLRILLTHFRAESIFRFRVYVGMAADRVSEVAHSLYHIVERGIDFIETHTKKIAIASAYVIAFAALLTLFVGSITGYEYSYNGKVLGIVKEQKDVYETISLIGDKLSEEYQAEIAIDPENDITFKRVMGFGMEISNQDDVLDSFTYLQNMKANAYALIITGKQVGILDKKSAAETVLETIKKKYLKKDESIIYSYVGFEEQIEIKEIETEIGNLENQKEVIARIIAGGIAEKVHEVQKGETFSEIAELYDIEQSQLQQSNPDAVPSQLKIGQKLVLTHAVPLLTVKTMETATYVDKIPYDIAYQDTKNLYKGDSSVKSKGINGEKQVTATIVRSNGVEVSREELSSKVLKDPVSQVVLLGSKPVPPLIGTGTFINPARGKLTSTFGRRWGRMHEGIDIGASTGTPIYASDGGKVIFSGYDGGYGYVVRIDHGGNRVTVYGHCSKLLVKKGEKVFQGQHIANVGNTGNSTGPHLHFEVRINGKALNPLNYVY